jgi:methyl coenzyme M reductase gamma subunit
MLTAFAVGGCGIEGSDPATFPMRCVQPAGRLSGTQVLMAQAVPSASLVPCVRAEIDKWVVTELDVGTGHVRVVVEYRPGDAEAVTIEVSPRCDVRGTHEVSSEHPGVRRFERDVETTDRYVIERYYTYPDACTFLRVSLTGRYAELRVAELTSVFGFVSRGNLDERIGEVSDRRLHLDPSGR